MEVEVERQAASRVLGVVAVLVGAEVGQTAAEEVGRLAED